MRFYAIGYFTEDITMQQSLCPDLLRRHFSDVISTLGAVNDGKGKSQNCDNVTKLKRRPNCKSRNSVCDESFVWMQENSYCKGAQSTLPKLTGVVPCRAGRRRSSSDLDQSQHAYVQTIKLRKTPVQTLDVSSFCDILCSSLKCAEDVAIHQVDALSIWLSNHKPTQAVISLLLQLLMVSKYPLVLHTCCRLLKRSLLMSGVSCRLFSCESNVNTVDILSIVLLLQKEVVKFMKTGQFSVHLLNAICVIDCLSVACSDVSAETSVLNVTKQWSSSELRCALVTVNSLAIAISTKPNLTLEITDGADSGSCDGTDSVRCLTSRVSQVVSAMLISSMQCELAQALNVHRILNEYWHTTDFNQRKLIVQSVLSPKLQLELCFMILCRHCGILSQKHAGSLTLDYLLNDLFDENVVSSAITQEIWMDDSRLSGNKHCQEMCVILFDVVSSYILFQQETRGKLLHGDMIVLQRLPDFAMTLQRQLSEVSCVDDILDTVSISALDRLACLPDVLYCVEEQ